MKPPKSILDKTFKYTPSAQTDLKKTFDRVQREIDKINRHAENFSTGTAKLVDIAGRKRGG